MTQLQLQYSWLRCVTCSVSDALCSDEPHQQLSVQYCMECCIPYVALFALVKAFHLVDVMCNRRALVIIKPCTLRISASDVVSESPQ